MKTGTFLLIGFSAILTSGCVYSHRNPPVVYSPTPAVITAEPAIVAPSTTVITPAPTVVTPTSDRPVVRVYPETPIVAADTTPTTVPSADWATADTIRKVLVADPTLASAARNVRISVLNGQVTMTGAVLTQHDRELLHSAIAGMPGVSRVDDRVQVELNR